MQIPSYGNKLFVLRLTYISYLNHKFRKEFMLCCKNSTINVNDE